MAPARRAGQNDGCEAAATVVLANRERCMPSGGATIRQGERRIVAGAAADAELYGFGAAQAAVMVIVPTRAGSCLEVSSTSLKLSRRLTLVEYA